MLKRLLILVQLAADAVRWCGLVLRSQRSIEAENLFLRRQLALYVERRVERRRIDLVNESTWRSFHDSFTGGTLWWWCARKR